MRLDKTMFLGTSGLSSLLGDPAAFTLLVLLFVFAPLSVQPSRGVYSPVRRGFDGPGPQQGGSGSNDVQRVGLVDSRKAMQVCQGSGGSVNDQ